MGLLFLKLYLDCYGQCHAQILFGNLIYRHGLIKFVAEYVYSNDDPSLITGRTLAHTERKMLLEIDLTMTLIQKCFAVEIDSGRGISNIKTMIVIVDITPKIYW